MGYGTAHSMILCSNVEYGDSKYTITDRLILIKINSD
jgi:hypothetical protein